MEQAVSQHPSLLMKLSVTVTGTRSEVCNRPGWSPRRRGVTLTPGCRLLSVVKKNNVLQLHVDGVSEHSIGPKQTRSSGTQQNVYVGGVPGEGAELSLEYDLDASSSHICSFNSFDSCASVHQTRSLFLVCTPPCRRSVAAFAT